MNQRRLQFGLLTMLVIVGIAAVVFACLRPDHFPADETIRADLRIPESIDIAVHDRQIVSDDRKTQYWATVHLAEQPHRLVRVWCQTTTGIAERRPWEPFAIHESFDTGDSLWRVCEQRYDQEPTEQECAEFRQFVNNFR